MYKNLGEKNRHVLFVQILDHIFVVQVCNGFLSMYEKMRKGVVKIVRHLIRWGHCFRYGSENGKIWCLRVEGAGHF